jgi:CRP/FNR family transcriptional regulator, anaerobic regulatory protein
MFEKLRAFFERSVPLTDEQFDFIKAHFTSRKVKKSEFLIRAGEVATYGMFIAAGCLRTYTIDDKGKEHILQFSIENWWVGDLDSYLAGVPATYFVDAIEDSELLLYDYPGFQKILVQVPALAVHYQQGLQRHAATKNKRIAAALSATAEERYADFLKTYPSIAQRVPQHMIASYLGITPETLSRIRKQLSRKP